VVDPGAVDRRGGIVKNSLLAPTHSWRFHPERRNAKHTHQHAECLCCHEAASKEDAKRIPAAGHVNIQSPVPGRGILEAKKGHTAARDTELSFHCEGTRGQQSSQ
jgi:hypothetical protein